MATQRGPRAGAISDVKSWLRQQPQPKAVRCDGKSVVRITNRPNKWAEAIHAIETLGARTLEALDGDGNTLRATELDQGDEPEVALATTTSEEGPRSDLVQVAHLISNAVDRAMLRAEQMNAVAFDRLARMFELTVARLNAIEEVRAAELVHRERAVARREEELQEAEEEAREAQPSTADGLALTLVQGAAAKMLGGSAPAKEGKQ